MTDFERNRKHHGHHFSEETGEFSVVTVEHCDHPGDSYPRWEPEITIFLQEPRQLRMIRVVDSRGNEHRLEMMGEDNDE